MTAVRSLGASRPIHYEASSYTEARDVPKNATVILGGDLVLVTTDNTAKAPDGYTALAPRSASTQPFKQSKNTISVFLRDSVATQYSGRRLVLSLEAVLAWLRSNKKDEEYLLVAGVPAPYETLAQVFHVRRKQVVRIEERRLPAGDEPSFRGDVFNYVERLRQQNPNVPIYWGIPTLACPDLEIPNVSEAMYKQAHRLPRLPEGGANNAFFRYVPGVLAALGGCAVYVMAVGHPYLQYFQARADFLAESHTLQAGVSYSDELLTLLKERQAFLKQTESRAAKVALFNQYLYKAGDPLYPLKEAYLQLVKETSAGGTVGTGPSGDFYFTIIASPARSQTALEQSRPIAEAISARVGVPLWIAPEGIVDTGSANASGVREYRLEGNFNAAP